MDFVDFNLAKKLKEKGFHWDRITTYNPRTNVRNNHLEPTISQVLKWLREDKGMEVYSNYNRVYKHWTYIARAFDDICYKSVGGFKSYEQAALAGIEYVLDKLI